MSQDFEIAPLQDSSVLSLDDMKDRILINPDYQREGQIWPLSKKQLFIDTLLNKYDVPKLYFHRLVGEHAKSGYGYAIIDGRQRLEAIWEFLRNGFPLADDFKLLEDPTVDLRGKYFNQLPSINARLSTRLYSRALSVMVVTTDDLDYIEDMFTRLNDGVPLNSAEKRNSFGGPLPKIARELAQHVFFTDRIRVSSSRYRHLDMAGKMLWLAFEALTNEEIPDTKRATLDTFFRSNKDAPDAKFGAAKTATEASLAVMAQIFGSKDALLRSSGTITVYFLLFMQEVGGGVGNVTRAALQAFEEQRATNRELFRAESDQVDFKLIEYDELAQSSNDAASIKSRLSTLREYLGLAAPKP